MQSGSGKASTNNFSVPEELWVYCRGYPDLINEILLFPLPRERWFPLEEDILRELQRRVEAHGTCLNSELVKAARGSLSLVLSAGLEVKVSGDIDRDNTILKRALRKEVSYEFCKELLGDHYWRRKLPPSLDPTYNMENEERGNIHKLLRMWGLSKLEKRLAYQLSRGFNIAEASRRLKIDPSTGRTLVQRIKKRIEKSTGTISK